MSENIYKLNYILFYLAACSFRARNFASFPFPSRTIPPPRVCHCTLTVQLALLQKGQQGNHYIKRCEKRAQLLSGLCSSHTRHYPDFPANYETMLFAKVSIGPHLWLSRTLPNAPSPAISPPLRTRHCTRDACVQSSSATLARVDSHYLRSANTIMLVFKYILHVITLIYIHMYLRFQVQLLTFRKVKI